MNTINYHITDLKVQQIQKMPLYEQEMKRGEIENVAKRSFTHRVKYFLESYITFSCVWIFDLFSKKGRERLSSPFTAIYRMMVIAKSRILKDSLSLKHPLFAHQKKLKEEATNLSIEDPNFAQDNFAYFANDKRETCNPNVQIIPSLYTLFKKDANRSQLSITSSGQTETFSLTHTATENAAQPFIDSLKEKLGEDNYFAINMILAHMQQATFAGMLIKPSFQKNLNTRMENSFTETNVKNSLSYSVKIEEEKIVIIGKTENKLLCTKCPQTDTGIFLEKQYTVMWNRKKGKAFNSSSLLEERIRFPS